MYDGRILIWHNLLSIYCYTKRIRWIYGRSRSVKVVAAQLLIVTQLKCDKSNLHFIVCSHICAIYSPYTIEAKNASWSEAIFG